MRRSPPPDAVVGIGVLLFASLFLGTVFFAVALPAWQDIHDSPAHVTGTVERLRSVRKDPVGYSIPSGGSKTTYYADVRPDDPGPLRPAIVGRGLYSRLKLRQKVAFDLLPHSGIVLLVRSGPTPNSVLSTDDPLKDAQWWAAAAPCFGGGAAALLAGTVWLASRLSRTPERMIAAHRSNSD